MFSWSSRTTYDSMLKYTDDPDAVAEAFKRGEVTAEDVQIYLGPRLEFVPETDARRLLNDLEIAVYTLSEPSRQARILEVLSEAARVATCHRPADADEA